MDKIILPPNFSLNKPSNKGLVFDTLWKGWMKVYHHDVEIPREDDAPYDASYGGKFYDVKLIPEKTKRLDQDYYVYLSHNEYLFGKQHDTTFDVYVEDGEMAERLIMFTFSFAKDLGAFELFADGKWVHCKATGRTEPPWSINVSRILRMTVPPLPAVLK